MPELALRDLCTPRQATFSRQRAETVAEIADLASLDAKKFFAETHITEGMGTLLRQVFQRLTGQSDQGVYRLKQAMGGGKTHNLLAAALLARDPDMRKVVLGGLCMSVDNRPIRVSAFSGRETDMREYLWERIFRDLGRESHWTRTSQEPGPSTWASVIGDEPALILLDELPPYFVSLASRPGGPQGSEADRLAIALANLMNAILSNKLPNCCLVISDLSGAWADGASRVQQAINNASQEVTRAAMDVVPVRLDSTELYGILRSKLFEKVAGDAERRAVGQEYATALRTAVQQGAVPGAYERWAQEVAESYPFHPGLHELFARFRENKDFQQTRETLRLAQRMVAGAWSGNPALADTAMLLHPHMVDLADADTASTFERINPALNNARTRDIATVGGAGVAQSLAASLGDQIPADAAKLIFLSSLAVGPDAQQGLTPEDVAAYLAAPGRDVSSANTTLMVRLEGNSWYLHRRTDGRWHYRDVKNVASAIRDRAETMNEDARRKEVESYLRTSFDPSGTTPQRQDEGKHAYQKLLVFPAPADVAAAVTSGETLLAIVKPSAGGLPAEFARVWNDQVYKNRLMFLFGSEMFHNVANAAAYMKAAEDQVHEFESKKMNEGSPEMQQARAALDRNRGSFLSALRETFTQLHFPDHSSGRLRAVSLNLVLVNNKYVGQLAILDTLKDQQKFRTDVAEESFRTEFETYIFRTKEAQWRSLMEATAREVEWYLVPPGGHETMKTRAIVKDLWRDEGGGYIKQGPFPREKTSVHVQQEHRDPGSGKMTLRVVPQHGADRVHYEEGGAPASINSPVVENGRLVTAALMVSFLAVDTTGVHEQGPLKEWQNTIDVKYQTTYRDGPHHVTLQAVPQGNIRYSLDGSAPSKGAVYDGEFPVPSGVTTVLAIAEQSGISSEIVKIVLPNVTQEGAPQFSPNPTLKAEWSRQLRRGDRGGSYKLLEVLNRHATCIAGVDINVTLPGGEDWINVSYGRNVVRTAKEIEEVADRTRAELESGGSPVEVSLSVPRVYFDSGAALEEAAKELGEPLHPDEVKQ